MSSWLDSVLSALPDSDHSTAPAIALVEDVRREISTSAATDEEPEVKRSGHTVAVRHDTVLEPLATAATATPVEQCLAGSPTTGASNVGSAGVHPTTKPRRQLGAMRAQAAAVVRRFWFLCRLRLRLRLIFRNAAATKMQALFRGYSNRKANADDILQRRNGWLMSKYANTRTVSVASLPPLHKAPLAARAIQLLVRRYLSVRKFVDRRHYVSAKRVQKFYRSKLFRRFMSTVADRRILRDRRSFAATQIQAVVRGFLARRWFDRHGHSLKEAAANRFPAQQRRQRLEAVEALEVESKLLLTREKMRKTQSELLEKIVASKHPNRDICTWSSESLTVAPLQIVDHAPPKKPLILVPASLGSAQFVSQATSMEPSAIAQYIEKSSIALELIPIVTAKEEAVRVAQRQLARKDKSMGKFKEESATMRYALDVSECLSV